MSIELLIIKVCGPSGSGKTKIIGQILKYRETILLDKVCIWILREENDILEVFSYFSTKQLFIAPQEIHFI